MTGLFSSSLEDSEPVNVDSCEWVQALTIEKRQTQSAHRIRDVVDLGEVNRIAGFRCVKLNFVTLCGPNLVRVPQVAPFDGDRGGGHNVYSLVKEKRGHRSTTPIHSAEPLIAAPVPFAS